MLPPNQQPGLRSASAKQASNSSDEKAKRMATCISSNKNPVGIVYSSLTKQRDKSRTSCPKPPPVADVILDTGPTQDNRPAEAYSKGRFLGKGGFARCWEVQHLGTQKRFAAKIIHKATLVKKSAQVKLQSEIAIHHSLSNDRVIKFFRNFEDNEFIYILLEVCENQTLADLMRKKKRLSENEVRYYVHELVLGLRYLRLEMVIHRDMKLGNLFLDRKWQVKIGDFGLAAQVKSYDERRHTICGTPNYIAPEILSKSGLGHSFEVDVWSLGVVLYTMLIGKPPFETDDVQKTYERIKTNSYQIPPNVNISEAATCLIHNLLRTNPKDRTELGLMLNHPFLESQPQKIPASLYSRASSGPPPCRQHTNVNNCKQLMMPKEDEKQRPVIPSRLPIFPRVSHVPSGSNSRSNTNSPEGMSTKENEFLNHIAGVERRERALGFVNKLKKTPVSTAGLCLREIKLPFANKLEKVGVLNRGESLRVEIPGERKKKSRESEKLEDPRARTVTYSKFPLVERVENERFENVREREALRRLEGEKLEIEKLEREKMEREKKEKEKKEKFEKQKLEKEKMEREKMEKEKIEKLEKQKLEKQKLEKQKLVKERLDREAEKERFEREILERESEGREKKAADKGLYNFESNLQNLTLRQENSSRSERPSRGSDRNSETDRPTQSDEDRDGRDSRPRYMPKTNAVITKFNCRVGEDRKILPKIWVAQWVDYSAKYGCGYLLSDGVYGVYYNDSTKVVSDVDNRRTFDYITRRTQDIPETRKTYHFNQYPAELSKKIKLLRQFRSHLNYNERRPGADDGRTSIDCAYPHRHGRDLEYIQKWLKTRHAIIFQLSDATVQVLFLDKSEVVLFAYVEEIYLLFVDTESRQTTRLLKEAVEDSGSELMKRILYARQIILHVLADTSAAKFFRGINVDDKKR